MPIKCPFCQSENTHVSIDEEELDDDGNVIVDVWCDDCGQRFDFPEDLNWRDYV